MITKGLLCKASFALDKPLSRHPARRVTAAVDGSHPIPSFTRTGKVRAEVQPLMRLHWLSLALVTKISVTA